MSFTGCTRCRLKMARSLVEPCMSVAKFTQILKLRINGEFFGSSRVSSVCSGFRLHFFGSSRALTSQENGRNCPQRTPCDAFSNFTCVFSTYGSANYRKDNRDGEMQDRVRHRIVQTRQKIRETGEKVKEKMEDFAVRRENILTIPNLLCGTRIVLSPILGYLVVQKSFEYALGVFVVAGLTDLLDGFIARNFKNQQSTFGSFLDPLADKFLVFCLVLSLTYSQLLPVPLTALIIARDACLIGASAYVRYLSLPLPKTWSSYFDVTHATARLSPTLISKYNTFVQLMLVACTLASPVFHLENHPFLPILWYITATTTVASALSYLVSKNTYHILKDLKEKK